MTCSYDNADGEIAHAARFGSFVGTGAIRCVVATDTEMHRVSSLTSIHSIQASTINAAGSRDRWRQWFCKAEFVAIGIDDMKKAFTPGGIARRIRRC
jgi:hypothetical protein